MRRAAAAYRVVQHIPYCLVGGGSNTTLREESVVERQTAAQRQMREIQQRQSTQALHAQQLEDLEARNRRQLEMDREEALGEMDQYSSSSSVQ